MTLLDLLSAAVLAFVMVRLVGGVRHSRGAVGRSIVRQVVRRIRWRHALPVLPLLTATIALGWTLMSVPVLGWGWWSAIGGDGNPVFGSTARSTGTILEWAVPLIFIVLLVPALPLFALAEERMFRRGAERWSAPRRVGKVVQFGLVHTLIGIPIGAALALSLGGGWFMKVYLDEWRRSGSDSEATLESAAAHTTYNAFIVGIVLLGVFVTAIADLRG